MTPNGKATITEQAYEEAQNVLHQTLAEGIEAKQRIPQLEEAVRRAQAAIALADQREKMLSADLARVSTERDSFMRYAQAAHTRLDVIGSAVQQSHTELMGCARAFDDIYHLAQTFGDKVHKAHGALNSLMTTIESAKLDARDALHRPQLAAPKGQTAEEPTEAAPTRPLPRVVTQGPRYDNEQE